MFPQPADFRAESDALHALLASLPDAGFGRATAHQFGGQQWVDVVHRVDVHAGGVGPAHAQLAHAPLMFAQHPARLLQHALG